MWSCLTGANASNLCFRLLLLFLLWTCCFTCVTFAIIQTKVTISSFVLCSVNCTEHFTGPRELQTDEKCKNMKMSTRETPLCLLQALPIRATLLKSDPEFQVRIKLWFLYLERKVFIKQVPRS